MSNPDWTEAPDQATHYDCNADVFCTADGWWHKNQYVPVENKDWGTDRYTPRPVEPAATAWDGTGLPPRGSHIVSKGLGNEFRPIRTRAQIEREEVISRASAVVDTTDLNRTIDDSFILRVAIDRLYDAGMLKLPKATG